MKLQPIATSTKKLTAQPAITAARGRGRPSGTTGASFSETTASAAGGTRSAGGGLGLKSVAHLAQRSVRPASRTDVGTS